MSADASKFIVRELEVLFEAELDEDLAQLIEQAVSAPLDGSSGARVDDEGDQARLLALPFIAPDEAAGVPLILKDGILRTQKLFDAELRIARAIKERLEGELSGDFDEELARFFPPLREDAQPNEARRFAEIAIRSKLTLLAGGPGTGKTYGVAGLLAVFIEAAIREGKPPEEFPRVALAAPTGKAAARMREAMMEALKPNAERASALGNHLSEDARTYLSGIPASTLHRLLGVTPRRSLRGPRFTPRVVDADIVVIDEASMIDLPLFARLLDQLRPDSRLLILGDPDQLPSVGIGSVLSDLISFEGDESTKLGRAIARLTVSRRYDPNSAIRHLADAILKSDPAAALKSLNQGDGETLERYSNKPLIIQKHLRPIVVENFKGLRELLDTKETALTELFRHFDAHRTLALEHHGAAGVNGLNESITEWLIEAGHIELIQGAPSIEPILILRNSRDVARMNGDIGFILRRDFPAAKRGAYFPNDLDGSVARLSPHELPEWTRAFAMTVHKSQGSQFTHVSLVYPEKESRVAGRELLFTAITRARERVTIYGDEREIARSIGRRTERVSGLRPLLRDALK